MSYPISQDLLSDFMATFFGYGNLSSPYWFIGKEEGGGATLEENYSRILVWENVGRPTTVDNVEYHQLLGFSELKLQTIQPTWTKLIQVLLELEGKDSVDKEIRREYQRHQLGRRDSNHCTLELMPMASRSTGLWLWRDIFNEYFRLPGRREYFEKIVDPRKTTLKDLVAKYTPKLVLFYSTQANYLPHWHDIIGESDLQSEKFSEKFSLYWIKRGETLFVITPHPTAHGLTVYDFPKIGQFIKAKL